MKVGLGCAFNSSEDCVGFVVDKVTLALIFLKIFGFRGQFQSTKAKHKYLFISFIYGNSDYNERPTDITMSERGMTVTLRPLTDTPKSHRRHKNKPVASDVTQHTALNFPYSKRKHWRK